MTALPETLATVRSGSRPGRVSSCTASSKEIFRTAFVESMRAEYHLGCVWRCGSKYDRSGKPVQRCCAPGCPAARERDQRYFSRQDHGVCRNLVRRSALDPGNGRCRAALRRALSAEKVQNRYRSSATE